MVVKIGLRSCASSGRLYPAPMCDYIADAYTINLFGGMHDARKLF